MGTDISAWYVVFVKRENQYWWDYIFSRGPYKHVCAIGYDPQVDQWYLYDWSFLGLRLNKLSTEETDRLLTHFDISGLSLIHISEPTRPY